MRRRSTRKCQRLHIASLIAIVGVIAISMTIGRTISRTPGAGPNHAASQGQRRQSAPGPVPAGIALTPGGKFIMKSEGAASQVNDRPAHDAATCADWADERPPTESESEHAARSNASCCANPKGPPASVNSRDDVALTIKRVINGGPFLLHESSDGDLQMLQYTTCAQSPRSGVIVHDRDNEPEVAYAWASHAGELDTALDEERQRRAGSS